MTRLPEHDRRLMLSFEGTTVPANVADTLACHDVSGVTLFRPHNYVDAEQLRDLTASLQQHASGDLPLLIGIDQEGGQLHAFGPPATMWPGNMALGATGDTDLTRMVAAAIGRELRAVGVNVNYAPNADLATNARNPATGARSFGDDPVLVSGHVKAFIVGMQSEGVAATMKHFPGKGDSEVDSHHAMPLITHDLEYLTDHEFAPFRAAVEAGVKLAMTGHFALPALTGSADLPCTLAPESNTELLRGEMGFTGVMITDALDMGALQQGDYQIVDMIAAINSGVDLLLLTADAKQEERATSGLALALSRRLIPLERLAEADQRVLELRRWVGRYEDPDLSVVGCHEHAELADRAAVRSITLLRDEAGLLPLGPGTARRILVVETEPGTITPADTSDYEQPTLADELRMATGSIIVSIVIPMDPGPEHLDAVLSASSSADAVVIGTASANLFEAQASLVREVSATRDDLIVVAQRTPWDLEAFPDVGTYLCAWSVHRVSSRAVARAIAGLAPVTGRTPVRVADHRTGSGLERR